MLCKSLFDRVWQSGFWRLLGCKTRWKSRKEHQYSQLFQHVFRHKIRRNILATPYQTGSKIPMETLTPPEQSATPDTEPGTMPLLAHLAELRRRILYAFLAVVVAFPVYVVFAPQIYAFLVQPLMQALPPGKTERLIYTSLPEAFTTWMSLGVLSSLFIAFPVLAWQIWRFVAPGLYTRERRILLPFLASSPLLFLAGAALAYFFIMPLAYSFFISFGQLLSTPGTLPLQLEARVSQYATLSLQIMFAFGVCFQLPVVLVLLAQAGFVTAAHLVAVRKYMILMILSVAAILTPPDVLSQLGLSLPLIVLYELSIHVIRRMERHFPQGAAGD
jgi:sec-independent protein translocase protein TatC